MVRPYSSLCSGTGTGLGVTTNHNPGEAAGRSVERVALGVRVDRHGEGCARVTQPRRDDGDEHPALLPKCRLTLGTGSLRSRLPVPVLLVLLATVAHPDAVVEATVVGDRSEATQAVVALRAADTAEVSNPIRPGIGADLRGAQDRGSRRSKEKVEELFWDAVTQARADLAGVPRR
jgi:hypothetical protein